MDEHPNTAPIACSLDETDVAGRRRRWDDLAARARAEITHTPSGLRLLFDRREGVAEELWELVGLERRCCAFADWRIAEDGDRVLLEISGHSDEGVAAVRAMFGGRLRHATRSGERPTIRS